jgi:hypothetical protein
MADLYCLTLKKCSYFPAGNLHVRVTRRAGEQMQGPHAWPLPSSATVPHHRRTSVNSGLGAHRLSARPSTPQTLVQPPESAIVSHSSPTPCSLESQVRNEARSSRSINTDHLNSLSGAQVRTGRAHSVLHSARPHCPHRQRNHRSRRYNLFQRLELS